MAMLMSTTFQPIMNKYHEVDLSCRDSVIYCKDLVRYHHYINYLLISKIEYKIWSNHNSSIDTNPSNEFVVETVIDILKRIFKNKYVFLNELSNTQRNQMKDVLVQFRIYLQSDIITKNIINKFLYNFTSQITDHCANEHELINDFVNVCFENEFQKENVKMYINYLIKLIELSNDNYDILNASNQTEEMINGGDYIFTLLNIAKKICQQTMELLTITEEESDQIKIDELINQFDTDNVLFDTHGRIIKETRETRKLNQDTLENLQFIFDNLKITDNLNFGNPETRELHGKIKNFIAITNFYSNSYELTTLYNELITLFNFAMNFRRINNLIYFSIKIRIRAVKNIIENFSHY